MPSTLPRGARKSTFSFRCFLATLFCLLGSVLSGCATAPSYAQVQATAVAGGCWPGNYVTPPPVTVTPWGGPFATHTPGPTAVPTAGPSPTVLPTTTPYPRCAAGPGEPTLIPWPTPVPNPPPYPTMEPRPWQAGSDMQETLKLPGFVLNLDIATHPTENWPVVGTAVWSGNDDPDRIFVNVYHPRTHTWSPARQVDIGDSQVGRYTRTVAVGVTGDGAVHAVWGMSDPDFRDNNPPAGVWASTSTDYGTNWSAPQRIADDCRRANDIATTVDGFLVVMLICHDGPRATQPAMVLRRPDGIWLAPERLPIPTWYFSEGSVVIVGAGADARAVGLLFAGGSAPTGFLIERRLAGDEPWSIRRLAIDAPGLTPGLRMWHVRGLAYTRPESAIQAITFTWTDADARNAVYALTSHDGGRSWGPVEVVVSREVNGSEIAFAAPAYDPAADRLAVAWTCCGADPGAEQNSTHFARWSEPGSGRWRSPAPRQDDLMVPLILGARAAHATVSAQAANSRSVWLAWVEQQQTVEVRSLELNQVIPVSEYPPATIVPGGTR